MALTQENRGRHEEGAQKNREGGGLSIREQDSRRSGKRGMGKTWYLRKTRSKRASQEMGEKSEKPIEMERLNEALESGGKKEKRRRNARSR